MGLLVGGSAGGSAIGVAPDAQWIAVKLYNDAGLSTLSTIHQGFQWLLDPDGDPATDDAPDLVNNSWGFSDRVNECFTDFEPDIAALRAADILVLFSAGNLGPASLTSISPPNNDGPLAVGALNPDLSIADFSSRGPAACVGDIYPELVAPGVNLRTSDLTLGGVVADPYVSATGTSFSAPLVSGVAALLRSAQPAASVADLELALTDSAVDLGPAGADDAYGLGLVDAVAAESLLATIVGQPPAPVCVDADGDGYPAGASCTSAELDCADQDATIHPGACDIKRDGIDQDCDGSDRTSGKACPSSSGTADTASEGGKKGCSDGVDNDSDGLTDCADPDCSSTRWCA
jgi:bacillopeptidase F